MKTFQYTRDNGSLRGFEIRNTFISLLQIMRILGRINGVTDVKRNFGSDDRVLFLFNGESCVVNEPFGDNSRYWIGPAFPGESTLRIEPLHHAFAAYEGYLVKFYNKFLRWHSNA